MFSKTQAQTLNDPSFKPTNSLRAKTDHLCAAFLFLLTYINIFSYMLTLAGERSVFEQFFGRLLSV